VCNLYAGGSREEGFQGEGFMIVADPTDIKGEALRPIPVENC
jgi:hypothetical protein